VIKLGDTLVALDDELAVLWHWQCRWTQYGKCPAYIPAVGDLTGDGRDEVLGGYFILNGDGTPRWQQQLAPNMDSVSVEAWDDGRPRAIASGGGHVLDADGGPVVALGTKLVPHGQEARVGRFAANKPEPHMVIRWNGHHGDAITVATDGTIAKRFMLNDSHNHTGMETVRWHGASGPDLLFNGGWLWNPITGTGAPLPDLPAAWDKAPGRMAWWHAIPVDCNGNGREELVVYDPWRGSVFIYGHADASTGPGFVRSPRTHNARLMD
jgi:hypothetical protein